MSDAVIVAVIIAVAAGYLVRRFMKKGSSGGCGCGSSCGGCGSSDTTSAHKGSAGCGCSSHKE
ncbi:FeoB-associated Cys-rich membrane protein [Halodesulfovibrio spirochaetisodalis]|uniref:FeoB-associated Cys-rich membrane protein n=1 Tax=Halodesulfovibrio spirochaetisodalis TaxID=1560234 RepID=A0A1B7XAW9_9BACT|nr:FeoB-associated Cys-rich membrane protein [Halodesulfovibrio spirochaetisodalis]OBQ46450.1 hypothetical protein SP90_12620 [Halodesulfovibrio spirochaetisodalis]